MYNNSVSNNKMTTWQKVLVGIVIFVFGSFWLSVLLGPSSDINLDESSNYQEKTSNLISNDNTSNKFLELNEIKITGSDSCAINEKCEYSIDFDPIGSNSDITWTISDEKIASIDNGIIVGKKSGKVIIKAIAEKNISTTKEITIYKSAKEITLSSLKVEISVGDTKKITATIKEKDAKYKKITWKSADENIVTVDQNGKIKAIKEGSTKIIAQNEEKITAECIVTVKKLTAKQIEKNYKKSCKKYKYKDLFRYPDKYKGKRGYVKGKVIQVTEKGGVLTKKRYELRVDTKKGSYGIWDDTIYVILPKDTLSGRVLEDDIIEFWGEWDGLQSYTSVLGAEITLPKFQAKYASLSK